MRVLVDQEGLFSQGALLKLLERERLDIPLPEYHCPFMQHEQLDAYKDAAGFLSAGCSLPVDESA